MLLMRALGYEKLDDEEFDELCFQFGLELDEVTTAEKELGIKEGEDGEEIIYKIEIPANRHDLLCLEGLSRSLLIFLGKAKIPKYEARLPVTGSPLKFTVTKSTAEVRPYLVGAVLRNITFTQNTYNSLIDLQEKLHHNICRKRTLASIGIHNLDSVTPPFTYDACPPNEIKFVPLNQKTEFTADQLMKLYEHDPHLKSYLPIVRDKPLYPVIYDSNNVVLSLPPIINGEHSRLSLETKNILIECTATDYHKAKIVVDTLVCLFSEYCSERFVAELIEIEDCSGEVTRTPALPYRQETVPVEEINKRIGITEDAKSLAELLTKMSLTTTVDGSSKLNVVIPPTRSDVLHACDIYEDVAIAFGYNNIPKLLPHSYTVAQQEPMNKLSDQLREQVAFAGFTETLTFALCSIEDAAGKLGKKIEDLKAVRIANPKTLEFQITRTALLPGLLKTIHANKKMPLPMKLFEISDIVLKDDTTDVGARNHRRLCAVHYGKTSGFEIVHGLLDHVMRQLEVPHSANRTDPGYYLKACEDSAFFNGRCAAVMFGDRSIGLLGILHPNVISNFDLNHTCSALEIDIEPFL